MVVALAFVVVIATLGVSVLAQQSSASNVQGVYTSIHQLERALDGAVVATLQGIRSDKFAGRDASAGGTICSSTTLLGAKLGETSFAGGDYDVYCAAVPDSGTIGTTWFACLGIGPPDCRTNRKVNITVCPRASSCTSGNVRLRTRTEIFDRNGEYGTKNPDGTWAVQPDTGWGSHIAVRSWRRNP